ncbi:MAG: hypothetical protein ACK4MY_02150 [Brevundimonas sp.]
MSRLNQAFLSPLYWQEFEDLTASVAEAVYGRRALVTAIGRPGQAQNGVDVHVDDAGWKIGIQCKRKSAVDERGDPRPGGVITPDFLQAVVVGSDEFTPKLDQFILATTAPRDAVIQGQARVLSEQRRQAGLCPIKLWAWDDFVTFLNQYDALERTYYDTILQVRSDDDHDRRIVDVVTRAFNRPAFEDPLGSEHGESFDQALADTVHALNDGVLLERRGRRAFEVAQGGRSEIVNAAWRKASNGLYDDVAMLRETYAVAKKQGRLSERNGYVVVDDPAVGDFMDRKRADCVASAQRLRIAAGLQPF